MQRKSNSSRIMMCYDYTNVSGLCLQDIIQDTEWQAFWKRNYHIFNSKCMVCVSKKEGFLPGKLALNTWESSVSFQSTCVLAAAATSWAWPGWSGRDGKMSESEKKESRGSSDAPPLRLLLSPMREIDMGAMNQKRYVHWLSSEYIGRKTDRLCRVAMNGYMRGYK